MSNQELLIRHMDTGDVAAGMRLKELAGWNQTEADWTAFLALEPAGCLVAEKAGTVVATGTAIGYGERCGWIGMILVDPQYRRQGIATCVMERLMGYLDSRGCRCLKLDATEAGAKVYEQMGFLVEYEVERWKRLPQPLPEPSLEAAAAQVTPPGDLHRLARFDEPVFGADRSRLLDWYCRRGGPAFRLEQAGNLLGFAMSRPGSFAFQAGPVVADDVPTARSLLARLLAAAGDRPAIIDLPVPNVAALELAAEFGFERSRLLFRMHRGPNLHPGHPERVFALAGFEYG